MIALCSQDGREPSRDRMFIIMMGEGHHLYARYLDIRANSGIQRISKDTFARATHSAYAEPMQP